jgi:DNA-binding FadR family transcriptional regulator
VAEVLHDTVVNGIGSAIASGDLRPGSVLNLERVCADYDISRSVAREAVRVLESKGLVQSRRRVGITVLTTEHWHHFDPLLIRWRLDSDDRIDQLLALSEVRLGVEPIAARLAAGRASPEQVRALAMAVHDMVIFGRSGELEPYLDADKRFHRTLLDASGNEMLAHLGDVVGELLEGRTHHGLMPSRPREVAIDLHDQVAVAVRDGDGEAAEAAMRAIIDEASAALAASRE